MRWSNLTTEAEEAHQLPGYRDPAVVRTFDAPEAMDIRFYEVRSRSALNRVPKASRMPFRWTINPYRGCLHACLYCVLGDTLILTADGRTKPIAELRVGDGIYGTVKDGAYRRYVTTTVQAHWETLKRAYRVTLEDGTELIASGDHRFLTRRGWKHVLGAEQGPLQRPHLTLNSQLMGVGWFEQPPIESDDYRRGYLCGMVRGDGHLGTYAYERPSGTAIVNRFRLALVDYEALLRTRHYLRQEGVLTRERLFAKAVGDAKAMHAIHNGRGDDVQRIRDLTRWPWSPSPDWRKGFLAGIFDAEGSCRREALRISNTDNAILGMTSECLDALGFSTAVDRTTDRNGLMYLRLLGGLREQLRFFHTVDPAIVRKRDFSGKAVKGDARLRVVSIEDLGMKLPMYDITTGTGDFVANGVISHNCFARPTHEYLGFDPGRDFEREIVVKVNAPEVLRTELARPSWKREHVALGTNTDPYQWVEGRYELMPEIWRALLQSGTPCSVLTKSPLLLRDIDLLVELHERVGFTASLSIPTLDEQAWRASEPHTPHPRKRIEAVAELNRAGVPTGVLIAPLMPGINDQPERIEELLGLLAEAGATHAAGIALHLRGSVRGVFMEWLRAERPELVPRYEELYRRGAYAPPEERRRLAQLVSDAKRRVGGFRGKRWRVETDRLDVDPAPGATGHPERAQPAASQQALF